MFDTMTQQRLLLAGLYHHGRRDEKVLDAVRELLPSDFVDVQTSGDVVDALLITWANCSSPSDFEELVRLARHRDGSSEAISNSTRATAVLLEASTIDEGLGRLVQSYGFNPSLPKYGNFPAAESFDHSLISVRALIEDPGLAGFPPSLYPNSGLASELMPIPPVLENRLTIQGIANFLTSNGWTASEDSIYGQWQDPESGEVYRWPGALEIQLERDAIEANRRGDETIDSMALEPLPDVGQSE